MKRFLTALKSGLAVCALCLIPCNVFAQSYPSQESLVGAYSFTAKNFTLNKSAYASYLTDTFVFSISIVNDQLYIKNFINSNSASQVGEYTQEDGRLKYKCVYFKPNGSAYLYIAPGGVYTGMSALNATYLYFQVWEDGSISIPDFDMGTVANNALSETYASWKNITVTKFSDDPNATEIPQKSFAGTYSFTGTKYEFPNGVSADPTTSALDFDLQIQYTEDPIVKGANNQLVQIAGYQIATDDISSHNTLYSIEDNTISYETAVANGVEWWQVSDIDPENPETAYTFSYVFGNENITEWSQDQASIVLTVNEDNTYSLKPFTIWKNSYEYDPASQNVVNKKELVFLWTNEAYIPPVEKEDSKFTGEYTLEGTYYNYTDGKFSSIVDGEFDLVINSDAQVTSIGYYQLSLADIEAGYNKGEENGDQLILTTGNGVGVQWPNSILNTTSTILLGGESTEAYSEGEEIIFTLNESKDTWSLTAFTGWEVNEDGTYTLLFKWDPTPFNETPVINIEDPVADLENDNTVNVSFIGNLSNIDFEAVENWIAKFTYTLNGNETIQEVSANVTLGETSTVGVTPAQITTNIELDPESVYSVTIVLQAKDETGSVIAESNPLTLNIDFTAISNIETTNEGARYFNLNGVEISEPQKGIYILVKDGQAIKIMK